MSCFIIRLSECIHRFDRHSGSNKTRKRDSHTGKERERERQPYRDRETVIEQKRESHTEKEREPYRERDSIKKGLPLYLTVTYMRR